MRMAPKSFQRTDPKPAAEAADRIDGLSASNSDLTLLDRTRELSRVTEECKKIGRESF
jgi:hypothetical protein